MDRGIVEAIRDWCKAKFQPVGNYLTEVPFATNESAGKVKPDGTSITIDTDGTLHAVSVTEYANNLLGGES